MRRTAVIGLLLATAILVAGCGKSSHFSTARSAHAKSAAKAKASAHGAEIPATKAEAEAFARAVTLDAADLPGFKAAPHERTSAKAKGEERELLRCMAGTVSSQAGAGGNLAEVASPEYSREAGPFRVSVSSGVTVAHSAAAAVRELAAIRSDKARSCLKQYLEKLLQGGEFQSSKARVTSIKQGTPSAAGASGAYGWRITADFTVHGVKVPLYMDFLGFVYDRAEVSLSASGLTAPFPAGAERYLFALLLERAKAQGKGGEATGKGRKKGKKGKEAPKAPANTGPRMLQIGWAGAS
jgi:hypothetical protein